MQRHGNFQNWLFIHQKLNELMKKLVDISLEENNTIN